MPLLDVLRAFRKIAGKALKAYTALTREMLIYVELICSEKVPRAAERVSGTLVAVDDFVTNYQDVIHIVAHEFVFSLVRTNIGALLIQPAKIRRSFKAEWRAAA